MVPCLRCRAAGIRAGGTCDRQSLDSILDNKTRQELAADHVIMHGVKAPVDGLFHVAPTGDPARYPRHEGLPAKQRVNCRCRTISVFPEWEAEDDAAFAAQRDALE
jgi:hypothetical protein